MTDETKTTIAELSEQLFNLSCELGQLSSHAHLLEDKADDARYTLDDLCRELRINLDEEEEDAE